jgi:hypothetical protein
MFRWVQITLEQANKLEEQREIVKDSGYNCIESLPITPW